MANESHVSCSIDFSKGGVVAARTVATVGITVTGANALSQSYTFSTANSQLVPTGAILTSQVQGYMLIINNDATNDLLVSRSATHAAGYEVSTIKPGKFSLIAVNNTVTACTYYAKSSASTVLAQILVTEQ